MYAAVATSLLFAVLEGPDSVGKSSVCALDAGGLGGLRDRGLESPSGVRDCTPVPSISWEECIDGKVLLYNYCTVCRNSMHSPGGVWLYCAITALLSDLPAELTACTAMLVYTLFLSSPVKL